MINFSTRINTQWRTCFAYVLVQQKNAFELQTTSMVQEIFEEVNVDMKIDEYVICAYGSDV